jgi:hypothetical protein
MLGFRFLSAGLLGALLTACSGGSSSQQVTPLSPLSPNVSVSSIAVDVQADELAAAKRCKTCTGKIYVANYGSNTVTTYAADGTPTTSSITTGLTRPLFLAIDAVGTIYVTNIGNDTLTTYKSDGTGPLFTISGLNHPMGVAVDATGKIYVANNFGNSVYTYNPNGTRSTPTLTVGLNDPSGVAVDANGKIYVANQNGADPNYGGTVTTYKPDGTSNDPDDHGTARALRRGG